MQETLYVQKVTKFTDIEVFKQTDKCKQNSVKLNHHICWHKLPTNLSCLFTYRPHAAKWAYKISSWNSVDFYTDRMTPSTTHITANPCCNLVSVDALQCITDFSTTRWNSGSIQQLFQCKATHRCSMSVVHSVEVDSQSETCGILQTVHKRSNGVY